MGPNKLYIGVDGGGTSTTAIALSSSGAVLGQASSGSTNFNSIGREKAKAHLHEAIQLAVNTIAGHPTPTPPTSLPLFPVLSTHPLLLFPVPLRRCDVVRCCLCVYGHQWV